jgi:hypothetical protein
VPLGLTDDECDELVRLLRATAASDRFPLSPRIRRLKAVLAQLDTMPALTANRYPTEALSSAKRRAVEEALAIGGQEKRLLNSLKSSTGARSSCPKLPLRHGSAFG